VQADGAQRGADAKPDIQASIGKEVET
jgi:hypothetical protein